MQMLQRNRCACHVYAIATISLENTQGRHYRAECPEWAAAWDRCPSYLVGARWSTRAHGANIHAYPSYSTFPSQPAHSFRDGEKHSIWSNNEQPGRPFRSARDQTCSDTGQLLQGPTRMRPGPWLRLHRLQPPHRNCPSSTDSQGQQAPTAPSYGITMEAGGYLIELRMLYQEGMVQDMAVQDRSRSSKAESTFQAPTPGSPTLNSPALSPRHTFHPFYHSQPHRTSHRPAAGPVLKQICIR